MKESNGRIRYILKLLKTNKVGIASSCVVFILTSVVGVISPILIKNIVDMAIVQKDKYLCVLLASLYLACQLGTILFGSLGLFLSERTANSILCVKKSKIIDDLLNMKYCSIENKSPAEINLILNSYIDDIKFFFADFPRIIIELTFLLLGSIVLIQLINKYVFIFIVIAAIINSLLYIIIKNKLSNIAVEQNQINKQKANWFQQLFNHTVEFLINVGWKNTKKESSKIIANSINTSNKKNDVQYISALISGMITMIITILIYVISNSSMTIGTVLATISFYNIILPLLNTFIDMLKYYTMLVPALDEVINIEKMITEQINTPIKRIVCNEKQNYFIENLTFEYDEHVILENANITFSDKGIVIIKSPNGRGKTTFAKIIMGLLNVKSGQTNIAENQISYLPQTSVLLPSSILFNITLNEDYITEEKLCEYFKIDNIDEFIFNTKRDLNATVPIDDDCFSGGEKRKICILRAMWYARKRGIIILDEPDAGLDAASIETLSLSLLEFSKNKLVIIISHTEYFDNMGTVLTISDRNLQYEK